MAMLAVRPPFVLIMVQVVILSVRVESESIPPFCMSSEVAHEVTGAVFATSNLSIASTLPARLGLSIVCQITVSTSAEFLSIEARKQSEGSLHVDVYDSSMANSVGRLDLSSNKTRDSTVVCLEQDVSSSERKYVVISGTPLLNFTAYILFKNHEVFLGKDKVFDLKRQVIYVFTPPKQIENAQLDITVQSDSEREAVLKVSHQCKQVEQFGVINLNVPSVSLTFAKKGRMTLSRVSRPVAIKSPLRPLFISISLNPNQGKDEKSKTVHINLATSFQFQYAVPICFVVLVSVVGGVVVAYWALFCFREPLRLVGSPGSHLESTSGQSSVLVRNPPFMGCCGGQDDDDELQPLIRHSNRHTRSSRRETLVAMWTVMRYHWIGKGRKTYSYITCIVGFVLIIGAFQFVYVNWSIMTEDGNRDKCFYNDWCYRVSPFSDIPFNLMISNLSYMIHGLILAVAVWIMEADLYVQAKKKAEIECQKAISNRARATQGTESLPRHSLVCTNPGVHLPELTVPTFDDYQQTPVLLKLYTRAYKNKYSFSVGYAFAWALIFEGIFSLTYHLCPSRLTFQFDSAFMFVIAGLIIVSLFNGFSVKDCQKEAGLPRPIEDTTFYLFIIVPLYILNYLGSVYNVDTNTNGGELRQSLPISTYVFFFVAMVIWYLAMLCWSTNKLFHSAIKSRNYNTFDFKTKLTLFVLAVICICIVFPIIFNKDFSHLFLFTCITAALASCIGKIILKTFGRTPVVWTYSTIALRLLQFLYVVFALVVMAVAIYVFQGLPTTEKNASPAKSRNLNENCALLGFYDDHDIWHMLSSFGLLMGAFLVMYISD